MKTNIRNYTDSEILKRVKSLPSYKKLPTGRWIVGVRSSEDEPNTYDDKFYEFEGKKFIRVLSGTTNSGSTILKGGFKKFNRLGSAVLKSDEWYYNFWAWGFHRGRMTALLQVGSKAKIYRDGNLNDKTEEIGKIYEGYYGINYHTNTYDFSFNNLKVVRWLVGSWSAGCQVINERQEYLKQLNWYRNAYIKGTQNFVTYVLLKEFKPKK